MSEVKDKTNEEYSPEEKSEMTNEILELLMGDLRDNKKIGRWLHGVSVLLAAKHEDGEDMTFTLDINGVKIDISLSEKDEERDPEILHFDLPRPPKFKAGDIQSTNRILEIFDMKKVGELVGRHMTGDWGDLESEDRELNEAALTNGDRLMSVYEEGEHRIYVITEADRSLTTVMFADEY